MAKHGMRLLSNETIDGVPYEQITVRAEQRVGNQIFDKWLMTINGPDVVGIVIRLDREACATAAVGCRDPRRACKRPGSMRTASVDPIAALPFSIEPTSALQIPQAPGWPGELLLKETPPPPEGQLDDVGLHRHFSPAKQPLRPLISGASESSNFWCRKPSPTRQS